MVFETYAVQTGFFLGWEFMSFREMRLKRKREEKRLNKGGDVKETRRLVCYFALIWNNKAFSFEIWVVSCHFPLLFEIYATYLFDQRNGNSL